MEEINRLLCLLENGNLQNPRYFYKEFSVIQVHNFEKQYLDEIICKTWKLVYKNILSKDIIYLSLLVCKNFELLKECLYWDKSLLQFNVNDSLVLFDYVVYNKAHWFDSFIRNNNLAVDTSRLKPNVYDKLLYLRILNITNQELFSDDAYSSLIALISTIGCTQVEGFWSYFLREVNFMINVAKIVHAISNSNKFEVFNYTSQNCILEVASNFIDLNKCYNRVLRELVTNKLGTPHTEDIEFQIKVLTSFSILSQFLHLIIPAYAEEINVNETVSEVKKLILKLDDLSLQIELLEIIFATIFIKNNDVLSFNCKFIEKPTSRYEEFICREKEVRLILFIVKSIVDEIKLKRGSESKCESLNRLNHLHKIVSDATWRTELITNFIQVSKCEDRLLYYTFADPESLINICLKYDDFMGANQVLKIFNMETSALAQEVYFSVKLKDLKDNIKKTIRMREMQLYHSDVLKSDPLCSVTDIVEDFFKKNKLIVNNKFEETINLNVDLYPFLVCYKFKNEIFMNMFDLAISHTELCKDSEALLNLAFRSNNLGEEISPFSLYFNKILTDFNNEAKVKNISLANWLLNIDNMLNSKNYREEDFFFGILEKLYDDFNRTLKLDEDGALNKDHPSHKVFLALNKHCNDIIENMSRKGTGERIKYLQKFFNYLRAFSKILYIEKDSSVLVSKGKNSSYFEILSFNRSELMGKLLFEENLDPSEFEKYFGKLKLDFLYHVTGNCFPTINLRSEDNIPSEELFPENILYTPTKAVIAYIQKRNWLLAFILVELYRLQNIELDVGQARIQTFLNYLQLPKIQNLKVLFKENEIITALQNEISYQKVNDFVLSDIENQELTSSSSNSSHSLETGEELFEGELRTTNWLKLLDMVNSIPEDQFKKDKAFSSLKDMILINLVKEAFDCKYYKYAIDISDEQLKINLIIENMTTWPEDFCIKIITSELSRFDKISNYKTEELKVWLKHIEHSKKVMNVLDVGSWSDMFKMCTYQPKEVINKLVSCEEVNLLTEFLSLHDVSQDMLLCIDEECLQNIFEINTNLISIQKLLDNIPSDHALKLCRNIIYRLKNVDHLRFVIDYLRSIQQDETFDKVVLSLKILSVFSATEFDHQFLLLLDDPLSIVEVLIMNTKLDKLAAVLEILKPIIPVTDFNDNMVTIEKVDELIRRYAEKSLDFRVITQPNPRLLRTPDHTLMQSLDSVTLDPSAKAFIIPDDIPSKEDWIQNTEVIECMCCLNAVFSMFNRRHHCRRCGRVVCGNCSKKRMIVPTYGDILVRVCIDCFEQTFRDKTVSDEGTSTKSTLDDFWMLTDDPEHNRIAREEFSYEFAPSVSLCLSLMKFHSKCEAYSKFLLEQCEVLLKLLMPNQEPTQEIDYLLVIRMLKSLAVAAKMASYSTSSHFGSSLADRILTQAELLGLLAERGCLNLLPTSLTSSFIDAVSLRKLTDKLLEREQWVLALEVSTKAGLEKAGIFAAWGKSCLKAGSLVLAREKFSKCLDKNMHHEGSYYEFTKSSLKIVKNPPLLNEIIKILETKKEKIDEDIINSLDTQDFMGSTLTLNQSTASTVQQECPIFIQNKLNNLKNIELGFYTSKNQAKQQLTSKAKMEDVIYDECVYYLNKYGAPVTLVDFHMKYGNFEKALRSILDKKLTPEQFVDVYVRCLENGTVETFQLHMSKIDSTLDIWKDHLIHLCCYLRKQNLLHCLYQLQLYMGDFVRAAITCVRFYEENTLSFVDLTKNDEYLRKSEEHLRQALEQEQWVEVTPVESSELKPTFQEKSITNPLLNMKMSPQDIDKHTKTISIQKEVAQFLANCESRGAAPMQIFLQMLPNSGNATRQRVKLPTLFDSNDIRKYLAVLCLLSGTTIEEGFEYATKIINEFKLKPCKVFNEAGKYLARFEKFTTIAELVNCLQKNTSDPIVTEMCDEMLILAVATLNKTNASEANVEDLIKLITDKTVKISAYIEAKQLKTAYFLATKYKRVMDIRRILREAEMSNQHNIKILCQKALQKYSQTSTSLSDS